MVVAAAMRHAHGRSELIALVCVCLLARWSWDEAEPDKFKHLKASCSETKYAESYVRMSGANPYAKTG